MLDRSEDRQGNKNYPGKPWLKKIGVIIVVLLILVGLFGFLDSAGRGDFEEGIIVVKAGGDVIGEVTIDEIRKLPALNKRMTIRSTVGLTKHEFTVTPLRGVFEALDPEITRKYKRVIIRGADNYVSVFSMEEVTARNNIFLTYEDQGQPLKNMSGEKEGVRIIGLEDQFGQRFTNYIIEIQLE